MNYITFVDYNNKIKYEGNNSCCMYVHVAYMYDSYVVLHVVN